MKPFSGSVRVAPSDVPSGVSRFIPALGYTRRGAEGIPGSHATNIGESFTENFTVNFTYVSLPTRVVFGAGSIRSLAAEVERFGAKRVLLISTPGRAEMVRNLARGLAVAGIFDRAVMHTPIAVVEAAREEARKVSADCCVAVGGGSTIGFGKAIALSSSLPVVAVPTTYSGSEMTTIWGVSEGGAKKTGRDPKVLPRAVIYDPELTLDLPVGVSTASGMNAIAHCAEALYAHDGNPIIW